jgi:hypothetical protein
LGKINFIQVFELITLLLAPVILFLLPPDYFDSSKTICIYHYITGDYCYGCGITKSIQHFIHGDFEIAFRYNKLVIVIFPLLVYLWTKYLKKTYKILKLHLF